MCGCLDTKSLNRNIRKHWAKIWNINVRRKTTNMRKFYHCSDCTPPLKKKKIKEKKDKMNSHGFGGGFCGLGDNFMQQSLLTTSHCYKSPHNANVCMFVSTMERREQPIECVAVCMWWLWGWPMWEKVRWEVRVCAGGGGR